MEIFKRKVKCLVCSKKVKKKDADIVRYSYAGGIGEAYVCKKCGDSIDKEAENRYDEPI